MTAEPRNREAGEMRRMAQPLLTGMGLAIRYSHVPLLLLALAYLGSGTSAIKEGEVALVLRFGALVGETPEEQVHRPGLLLAWPRPIDEVLRVDVERMHELEITGLDRHFNDDGTLPWPDGDTLDLTTDGYALTGDRNILHAMVVVRYVVSDPVAYALNHVDPKAVLESVVQGEVVAAMGEVAIDDVLSEELRLLLARVHERSQDQVAEAGIELISVEFGRPLEPPEQVIADFLSVPDAWVEMRTTRGSALRYNAMEIPAAEGQRDTTVRQATIYSTELLADARADAQVFTALAEQVQRNPEVVRERLYREALEKALGSAGKRLYVPPPAGERYGDMRITISTRR